MKKIIYGAAAALLMGAASCQQSGSDKAADVFFSAQATDSLLSTFGNVAGYGLNQQITRMMATDSTISKQEFLKGVQYAMAADTSETYINGVITGLRIQQQLKSFRDMGIKVDPSVVLDHFKKAVLADSVPNPVEMQLAESEYRQWYDSLMTAKRNHDRAILEQSEEALQNVEAGKKFIDEQKAANDSVKVTASGLGYKIINAGAEPKVNPDGVAKITYTAKTASGRVIDQAHETNMRLSNRVDGFKEGVAMLGKGGKAVLYVPGKLAYGVEAPGRFGIGPNELVVYEVEVVDIPDAQ